MKFKSIILFVIAGLLGYSCSTFKPCNSYMSYIKEANLDKYSRMKIKHRYCLTEIENTSTSTSKFEGYIFSRLDGAGVVASVYVKELNKGTMTDSTGWFSMDLDRKNDLSIEVRVVGYDIFNIDDLDFEENSYNLHLLLGTTVVK